MSSGGRRLRNVRIREAVRAFQKLGYEVIRVSGAHYILKHPEHGLLVLPFHKGTIKIGILLDALKKANISVEEFQKLL
jgi:predicted RNA binding protein YcfA (HicA-like mRNA interferase family)